VRLSDFDYELPPELIAQHPAATRTGSRLMHVDGVTGAVEDLAFPDIVRLLGANDLLVLNDTRVIKARLRGRKDSGGEVEVLVERVLDHERALAQLRASKPPKAGRKLLLAGGQVEAEVLGRAEEFRRTSRMRPSPTTIRVTRPFTRESLGRLPRPLPGCISTMH
jgi:S-adenosylmethionine:tRNA ribosyltransferase-isomerase